MSGGNSGGGIDPTTMTQLTEVMGMSGGTQMERAQQDMKKNLSDSFNQSGDKGKDDIKDAC
jgi:hypothetical protein